MTMRILFVCLGNICRSPTAEAVTRSRAKDRGVEMLVDSCGTGGWHTGDAPDLRMQAAARRAGYDMADLRARQLVVEDYTRFDLIVAMDKSNLAEIERRRPPGADVPATLMLSYSPIQRDEVPDPYYEGGFERVVAMIEGAADGLLDALPR